MGELEIGRHEFFEDDPRPALTKELIQERIGFKLTTVYPGFAKEQEVTPSLQEDLERMGEQYGGENVLPSFFMDEQGVVQLGLFIREQS